ncbi:MAG: type II secretion system F family protein [Verrucomicrobiota bacterium]
MIDAGLGHGPACLQALADQTTNKAMRMLSKMSAPGSRVAMKPEALARHPNAFNRLYVAMVGAGEKGGLLAEILARLAVYLENTARLRKKVKSAMMYPTVVTVVAIGITVFLLVKVIPVFGDIYSGFGRRLARPHPIHDQSQQDRAELLLGVSHCRRRGSLWVAVFHQDQSGT